MGLSLACRDRVQSRNCVAQPRGVRTSRSGAVSWASTTAGRWHGSVWLAGWGLFGRPPIVALASCVGERFRQASSHPTPAICSKEHWKHLNGQVAVRHTRLSEPSVPLSSWDLLQLERCDLTVVLAVALCRTLIKLWNPGVCSGSWPPPIHALGRPLRNMTPLLVSGRWSSGLDRSPPVAMLPSLDPLCELAMAPSSIREPTESQRAATLCSHDRTLMRASIPISSRWVPLNPLLGMRPRYHDGPVEA